MESFVVRPAVGMHQMVAVPYVVALGICDALPQAGIAWPHDVVDASTGSMLFGIETRGGYDEHGMFVRVGLACSGEEPNEETVQTLHDAITKRVDAWSASAGPTPLGAVLGDYANGLVQLGRMVSVVYPSGREYAQGTFVGVDVWGRATVRMDNDAQIEFPPEKYRIR